MADDQTTPIDPTTLETPTQDTGTPSSTDTTSSTPTSQSNPTPSNSTPSSQPEMNTTPVRAITATSLGQDIGNLISTVFQNHEQSGGDTTIEVEGDAIALLQTVISNLVKLKQKDSGAKAALKVHQAFAEAGYQVAEKHFTEEDQKGK